MMETAEQKLLIAPQSAFTYNDVTSQLHLLCLYYIYIIYI